MHRFVEISPSNLQFGSGTSELASPGYESIILTLARQTKITSFRRERAKENHSYFRAHVKVQCNAETITQFHSSRSGYRAQYYSSTACGERANRYALSVLVPRIGALLEGNVNLSRPWWWIEKSLLDSAAKLWIHQGQWLRANARKNRNLLVKRWLAAQTDGDEKRRKKARWSMLTPESEIYLELKGGFLTSAGASLGSLKKTRSRDLHELGFT